MASAVSHQNIPGFSRKHGVMIFKLPNTTIDSYLVALTAFIPPKQISHVSCRENNVIVYFSSEDWAEAAIIKGLVIDNKKLDVQPVSSTKIIISDVPPEISDVCLREVLMKYGSVVGPITSLPAEIGNTEFAHILSFRRRAFFDFCDEESIDHIPKCITITIDDVQYSFEIEIDVVCTHCKDKGHIKKKCPKILFPPTIVIKEEVESDSEDISVITEIKRERNDDDSQGLRNRNRDLLLLADSINEPSTSVNIGSEIYESFMNSQTFDTSNDISDTLNYRSNSASSPKLKKACLKKKPKIFKRSADRNQISPNFTKEKKQSDERREIDTIEPDILNSTKVQDSYLLFGTEDNVPSQNSNGSQERNSHSPKSPVTSSSHQQSPEYNDVIVADTQTLYHTIPFQSSKSPHISTSPNATHRSSSYDNINRITPVPVKRPISVGTYHCGEYTSENTDYSPLSLQHSPECLRSSNEDSSDHLHSLLRSAKKRKQDCRMRSQKECGLCLYNDLAKISPLNRLTCDNMEL